MRFLILSVFIIASFLAVQANSFVCHDEECCETKQNPNPETGNGYLEFKESCLNGGLHCVEESGCQLCFNPCPGCISLGNRPACQRFCRSSAQC